MDATVAIAPGGDQETPRDYYIAMHELYQRHTRGLAAAPESDLTPAELRVSSQNGEDGVIVEILRRAGTRESPYFVEFGAEVGAEGNCVFLADVLGWSGLLIEADPELHRRLTVKYRLSQSVQTRHRFVTAESVQEIFDAAGVPVDFDVLSIDIDSQDWWIWRAIARFRPRVVIVEYNAGLPADSRLAEPEHHENPVKGFTTFFGASIGAFQALGEAMGYRLVHTELTGANAFFVRSDLPGEWPPRERVVLRGLNYRLRSHGHPADPLGREFVDISPHLPQQSGEGASG